EGFSSCLVYEFVSSLTAGGAARVPRSSVAARNDRGCALRALLGKPQGRCVGTLRYCRTERSEVPSFSASPRGPQSAGEKTADSPCSRGVFREVHTFSTGVRGFLSLSVCI